MKRRKKDILDKGNEKLDLEFNDFLEKIAFNIGKYNKEIESSLFFMKTNIS